MIDVLDSDAESASDTKSGASDLDWDRPPGENSIRKKAKTTPVKKLPAEGKTSGKGKDKAEPKEKKVAVPKAKPAKKKVESDFDDNE